MLFLTYFITSFSITPTFANQMSATIIYITRMHLRKHLAFFLFAADLVTDRRKRLELGLAEDRCKIGNFLKNKTNKKQKQL